MDPLSESNPPQTRQEQSPDSRPNGLLTEAAKFFQIRRLNFVPARLPDEVIDPVAMGLEIINGEHQVSVLGQSQPVSKEFSLGLFGLLMWDLGFPAREHRNRKGEWGWWRKETASSVPQGKGGAQVEEGQTSGEFWPRVEILGDDEWVCIVVAEWSCGWLASWENSVKSILPCTDQDEYSVNLQVCVLCGMGWFCVNKDSLNSWFAKPLKLHSFAKTVMWSMYIAVESWNNVQFDWMVTSCSEKGVFVQCAGLDNPGNMCFMNASFQILFHLAPLVSWMEEMLATGEMEKSFFTGRVLRLFKSMRSSHGSVRATEFSVKNVIKQICAEWVACTALRLPIPGRLCV